MVSSDHSSFSKSFSNNLDFHWKTSDVPVHVPSSGKDLAGVAEFQSMAGYCVTNGLFGDCGHKLILCSSWLIPYFSHGHPYPMRQNHGAPDLG